MAFVFLGPGAPAAKSIGILSVSPTNGLVSGGFVGGPFIPSSQVYVLTNRGTTSLTWAATRNQNWVGLSAINGTLASHATASVTVSINSNANALVAGNYSATVTFTNRTNINGTTSRLVSLTVNPIPAPSGLIATTASTNQINLSWADNSSNETSFRIERAPDNAGSPGTWSEIATVTSNVTTYSDTNLSPSATYWYRVRAHNAAGDSAYSNQSSATTLPLPPSNLIASAVSTNQINLSWTGDPSGETGFLVERAPDSSGAPGAWTQIVTVGANVTTYSDAVLSANTAYWYRVRAYNTGGDSSYSSQNSATTPPPGSPNAPANLLALVVSMNQVNLSWTDTSTNEAGFKIERSLDGTNFTQIAQVLPNTTNFRNTGLAWGSTYYYRIRSYNLSGNSAYTQVVRAEIPSVCLDGPICWGENRAGQSTPIGSFNHVIAIAAGYYQSLALQADGTVIGWGSLGGSPPAGLTGVVAVACASSFSLGLKSDGTVVAWGNAGTPPAGLTGVVAIAAGFFHGLALKGDGTVVGWGDNTYGEATPPTNLTGVVAIAGGLFYSLALKSDGTVVGWGYQVGGAANPPTGLSNVVSIAAGTASLALLGDGTVVGWGGAGQPAGLSNVVSIGMGELGGMALQNNGTMVVWGDDSFGQTNVPAGGFNSVVQIAVGETHNIAMQGFPFSALTLTAAAVSSNQINLSWTGVAYDLGSFSLEIDRAPDIGGSPGVWAQLTTVASNSTSYSDVGLPANTVYWYRVRSFDRCGSPFSTEATATTLPTPAAPSNLSASGVATNQINLAWTNNAILETGFKIERALDSGGSAGSWAQIATVGSNATTYSDVGLTSGTKYWYRVRSSNAGFDSPYCAPASAITVCSGSDPMILTQPVSQVVCAGSPATFSVSAMGSELTYQWQQNGTNLNDGPNLSGSQTPTLTISNIGTGLLTCGTISAANSSGTPFGNVIAGQTYTYQASGCAGVNVGCNGPCNTADPDGNSYSGGSCSGSATPGQSNANFQCSSLKAFSLVGKVNGACVQMGSTGSFVAPSSGTLMLYFNDDIYNDNSGSWNVCIAQPPSGNYDVVVSDTCGSLMSTVAVLTVNSTPGCMTLVVTSPADYAYTTNAAVTLTGTASASAGIASVTVNGAVTTSTNGFANWTSAVSGLAVGTNAFTVIATDQAIPPNSLTNLWYVIYATGAYDGNGDGLPDAWQLQYFGCVTCPQAGPGADPDGDGLTNLQEFQAGSNPTAPAPPDPSNLTPTAVATNQINLLWSDNSTNEDGFIIERAPDNGGSPGTWAQLTTVSSNVTAFSDMGLLSTTTYWYRVHAYNAGGISLAGNQASATTPPPAVPSNLTATVVATNQINLSWQDNSNNEDGFIIERAPDSGGSPGLWSQIATVTTNVTTYADTTGLSVGATYWYRVRAHNVILDSDYSNLANASIPLPPAAPTGLTATPVSGAIISLAWVDNSSNETGFAIERAPDNSGLPGAWAQIATVNSNITAYTNAGLTTNTTYWYRVRASNAVGFSPYSNQANATTLPNLPDSWSSPASGKWETAGSWSLGVPPSVFLLGTLITNDNTKTVTIDAATVSNFPGTLTISNLTVAAPPGVTNTLLLSTAGNTNRLHVLQGITLNSGGFLDVENSLLQVDEALKTSFVVDGTLLFQTGSLISAGRGVADGAGQLIVGNVATGRMMAADGTIVAGTITVGNLSGSQGTLTISGTAAVRCSQLSIGQKTLNGGLSANATGVVWVIGGELTTTNGGQPNTLYVGNTGTGQMTVSNGMVLSARVNVGNGAGSCGTLTVAGGSVNVSSLLNIGSINGAAGAVWVTGGRLVITNGTTIVGGSSTGQLTVTAGNLQALSMIVGQSGGSQGSLIISGGTATVWSSLVVGDCATTASGRVTVVSGGSLFVTNATHTAFLDVRNGTLVVGNGGVLVVDRIIGTNGCGRILRSNGGTIIATALTLDPSLSAVGDNISNAWKQQYGLDPFDPSLANQDPDGDGKNNLQEFLAGTDPTNSADYFHITSVVRTSNDLAVTWTTANGKTNALQAMTSSSYDTNTYADIFIVTNTVGPTTNYLDLGAATNTPARYYRVRLVP